jgi:hypothetical protein
MVCVLCCLQKCRRSGRLILQQRAGLICRRAFARRALFARAATALLVTHSTKKSLRKILLRVVGKQKLLSDVAGIIIVLRDGTHSQTHNSGWLAKGGAGSVNFSGGSSCVREKLDVWGGMEISPRACK